MIATITQGRHSIQGELVAREGTTATVRVGSEEYTGRLVQPEPADMTRPGDTIHET